MEQEILQHLTALGPDPGRIPAAMVAWLVAGIAGMVTGPLAGNANPFLWLLADATFGRLGRRLDKRERAAADLLFRGFIMTVALAVCAYGLGLYVQEGVAALPLGGASEIVALSLSLTSGTVCFILLRLYFTMRDAGVGKGGYYGIAVSARTDLSASDDYGITRAGMGYAARSFDKGLVSPVFWYLMAGLPGACLYAALAAFAWRFGRDGFTKGFGKTALALEKLMGIAPHLLAGLLMALAGLFTPTGGMTRAFRGLLTAKGRARYEEGGLPLTAMAWSLDAVLGGAAVDLDGRALKRDWVGPPHATARLEKGHLRRALYITAMAHLLFVASLAGAMVWAGLLFSP